MVKEKGIEQAPTKDDLTNDISKTVHFLLIELNEKKYFISLSLINKIIHPLEIFPLPDTLNFIAGVMNYSGEIIPMVDLKKVLHLPELSHDYDKKFIICKYMNLKVGLIVDNVLDSLEIPTDLIKIDSARIQDSEFISGECILEKEVIEIIDIVKFISTFKAAQ
jgi:purine-binding chemotaxis protein CheW